MIDELTLYQTDRPAWIERVKEGWLEKLTFLLKTDKAEKDEMWEKAEPDLKAAILELRRSRATNNTTTRKHHG